MSNWQGWLYVAAVLIPLGAFVVQFVGLRVLGRVNAWIATLAIGTACVLSTIGFVDYLIEHPGMLGGRHAHAEAHVGSGPGTAAWTLQTEWVALGGGLIGNGAPLTISLGVHIDGLAVTMFLMVSFVATLIHVYSMGYMSDDPGYPRFFAFLSLFCFSMLGLVASASIFMVFIFWELVGVCSYLLIGFWYQEKANCDAANKAFIVNRVGDIGMLIGLGILWSTLGTFSISEINHSLRDNHGALNLSADAEGTSVVVMRDRETATVQAMPESGRPRQIPFGLLTIAGLGIFAGCVGKSAQFPLHVWLPDAMAGPTPVSALIHAATMVAAGVYLVGRFYPVFTADVLLCIAYTGGITLFIGATIACVQTDYKKVLAYSTVSQLGFMMLGLGVGGWSAGLFHLLTHAFFKALLFLGAGSVYHAVHTYQMAPLGGLRRKMPVTALTMLMGTMAISGVPLFSGFYSKDAILASAIYFAQHQASAIHWLLFVLPAVGATLTAFYMFRMWFLIFDGEPRGYPSPAVAADTEHGHGHHANPVDHAHESPGIMTWPLILLAIPAVVVGWPITILPFFGYEPVLEELLASAEPLRAIDLGATKWAAMGASLLIFVVGTALAVGYYSRWAVFSAAAGARRFGPVYAFLTKKWYFDELYDAVFVRPILAFGRLCSRVLDGTLIDGLVNGSASFTARLSQLEGAFDQIAVDRFFNTFAGFLYFIGDWGRMLQTGRLRNYLMVLAIGVVVLFLGIFRWIQGG